MKKNNSVTILAVIGALILVTVVVSVCLLINGDKKNKTGAKSYREEQTTAAIQGDISQTAVVVSIADENHSITIQPVEESGRIICVYNEGTGIYNRHDDAISIDQLHKGDVVDVIYDNYSKILSSIKKSNNDKVWENTKVTSFLIDNSNKSMKIGQTLYRYTDDTLVFQNDEIIDITELYAQDQLIVRGYDQTVVSIIVEKGHGYISLTGESLFMGGLVDVGGTVVKVIEDDMLIIVREGSYKVEVRNGQYIADQSVTVGAGQQSVVDFSGVTPVVNETGSVKFNISADNARLYLDGRETDYSQPVVLTTGKHTLLVQADGYEDYTSTLVVAKGHATININLGTGQEESSSDSEKETETTGGTESTETVTSESHESTTNTVTVKGPEGGYVYVDGAYKGIAPVNFPMITGTHVISIINNNEIKSYTVTLIEGANDVTYDFSNNQ